MLLSLLLLLLRPRARRGGVGVRLGGGDGEAAFSAASFFAAFGCDLGAFAAAALGRAAPVVAGRFADLPPRGLR